MSNTTTSIGQTILSQLGGSEFIALTGSKDFYEDKDEQSLTFSIPKNTSKANRVKITLTPDDLYTMEFYNFRPAGLTRTYEWREAKREDVSTYKGVYCDQLCDIFESVTGMYTTLFPRR